jgi:acetyl-CoA carboxylase beta subunit
MHVCVVCSQPKPMGADERLEILIDTGPTHNYDAAALNKQVTHSLLL